MPEHSSKSYVERRDPSLFPDSADREPPAHYYANRPQGYIDWIEDYLGVGLTDKQKEIVREVHENQRTIIVGANGFGKSFTMVCLSLAFLFVNFPASVLSTSGTYGKLRRTYCKPLQKLHDQTWGIPGRYLQYPPRIVIDGYPDVFLEASAPRDAGELEGVHNKHTLGIVEEADKKAVDEEVMSSMESLMTDEHDRIVVIANPPKDEANVVADLMDDPSWRTLRYSSFDSHNVQVEMNHDDPYETDEFGDPIMNDRTGHYQLKPEVTGQMKDGLVRLSQVRADWESWNGSEWPGTEKAMNSEEMDNLSRAWYIRRLGVMPPITADVHRPFDLEDVKAAYARSPVRRRATPTGLGLDVARGTGDYNALAAVYDREIEILDFWHGTDHIENEEKVRELINPSWSCPFAVDSVGVGDGLSDRISTFYPNRVRFNAGANGAEPARFSNMWSEGMWWTGEVLRDGGSFGHSRLREEMLAAARSLTFNEKYRGKYDSTVLNLDSKAKVKDRLGRSPDILDAGYMAVWASQCGRSMAGRSTVPSTW